MNYVFLMLLLDISIKHDFVTPSLTIPSYYAQEQHFKFVNSSNISMNYAFQILLSDIPIEHDFVAPLLTK